MQIFHQLLLKGKSVGTFIILQVLIMILFSIIYWVLAMNDNHFKGLNSESPLVDFLYYSITTQTTVGYGDITPISRTTKILAMMQMTVIYLGIGLTEHKLLKSLSKKGYGQPLLLVIVFIIAAFAPPIFTIIVHAFKQKKSITANPAIKSLARQMVKKSIHGQWF